MAIDNKLCLSIQVHTRNGFSSLFSASCLMSFATTIIRTFVYLRYSFADVPHEQSHFFFGSIRNTSSDSHKSRAVGPAKLGIEILSNARPLTITFIFRRYSSTILGHFRICSMRTVCIPLIPLYAYCILLNESK